LSVLVSPSRRDFDRHSLVRLRARTASLDAGCQSRLAIEFENHIAVLETGFSAGLLGATSVTNCSTVVFELELVSEVRSDILDPHAGIAARYLAITHQTGHDVFGKIGRDGEANPGYWRRCGCRMVVLIDQTTSHPAAAASWPRIGFAIPANLAKDVMTSLVRDGKVTRGYAGMWIQDVTSDLADQFKLKDHRGAM